jgi:hypothetical protein
MFSRNLMMFSFMILALIFLPACDVSLRPKKEVNTIIMKPGNPGIILQDIKVTLKHSDPAGTIAELVPIAGWEAMPPEHFEAMMKAIDRLTNRIKVLESWIQKVTEDAAKRGIKLEVP